jgi:hypothetical protein
MTKKYLGLLAASVIGLLFSVTVPAQDSRMMSAAGDKYVISAKAGGVNFVEGNVTVVRKNGKSGHLLKGDELDIGDKATTGADGKAELLMNPGSYVRLGGNSTFEFATTTLDDLNLRLNSGSAIFEVFASDDFKVTVNTPGAKMFLIQNGVYRVDVMSDGGARISVIKGRAQLADIDATIVKKGNQAIVKGEQSDIAKFDNDNKDQLATWSKERAKELSRISQQVQTAGMRNSLMSSFLGRGWNLYNSFGLWAYDPFFRSFCFVPFGYRWNSPYGYGYGPNIYWYNLPPVVYTPPANTPTVSQNTPIVHTPRNPDGPIRPPLSAVPPFVRMQDDSAGGGGGGSIYDNGGGRGRGITNSPNDTYTPTYSTPSAPAPSAPAPMPSTTRSDTKGKDN